jgi:hypothetical protein
MHIHLKAENVYLDPRKPSVQLVDVGFVQQDESVQDSDNPEVATVSGIAGFLQKLVAFPPQLCMYA